MAKKSRRWIKIVLVIAALVVLAIAVLVVPIAMSMPPKQGARIDGGGFVGIDTGSSYVWIVTSRTGVVLIDAGMSPDELGAVRREIAGRTVHAILITHGHLDHIGGLPAFPRADVITGPGEAAMLRGEVRPRGALPGLLAPLVDLPPAPRSLRDARHDETLELDGETFRVVHTPGHTGGSAMYLWNDVLFSGDSLMGHGDHVAPTHSAFADDYDQNVRSIARLVPLAFDRMADGHAGIHRGAHAQVEAFVAER